MRLKWMSLALLIAGWTATSAAAFTTADNASQAPVAKPQAAVAGDAKAQPARRAAEATASRPATGRERNETPTKPSATDKGNK